MHSEEKIPVFEMELGSKEEKRPIFVTAPICPDFPLPQLLPFTHVSLFRIEVGRDGSIYTAPGFKATECGKIEPVLENGSVKFNYKDQEEVPVAWVDHHGHMSFHKTGVINPPGYMPSGKGAMKREMVFKLADGNFGYQQLCIHSIGDLGMYQPYKPRTMIDAEFNIANLFIEKKFSATFEIDVAPFDGDLPPILVECGKDYCVSYGYLTPPVPIGDGKIEKRLFIRVKYRKVPVESPDAWPTAHHLIAKVKA